MKKCPVIFIAYREYDNLGIGYMESVLSEAGYKTKTINLLRNKYDILRIIKNLNPKIIGFSVIFEENLERYSELASFLRREGIRCHFTAGGHFASLKYKKLFEFIPQLDSIVRFEGEYTMLEIVNHIYNGSDWKITEGVAYRDDGRIIANKLRPFEMDLDKFPFPIRQPLRKFAFKKKFATILSGRGCLHNCSFCNTRKFYSHHAGSVKRIRRPEMVAEEMFTLFSKKNCRIFLFLDDDFPVKTGNGSDWIQLFCKNLNDKGISNNILWKISCRGDEVEEEIFSLMKKNGLFSVFIGIEDGTENGLKMMNKGVTVSQNINGINILKKLGIAIDFGFLIFHPSTTFESFNENLSFLRKIFDDGFNPIKVSKMIPSYDTHVESDLKNKGRLKISGYINDYDFLDESMNKFYEYFSQTFAEWQNYPYGVVNLSKWARDYYLVFFHYFGVHQEIQTLYRKLNRIISESNLFFLDTLKELSEIFESGQHLGENDRLLNKYRKKIELKYKLLRKKVQNNLDTLILYSIVYK
jgi:anaerobic magnesium-protoporphyrin IX monomethyl ester cyclase